MTSFSFKEFRPTIFFLIKFIGLYLVGNLLYGFYITSYHPKPDPVTHWISGHTAGALSVFGWPTTVTDDSKKPTTILRHEGRGVLAIYEGCNGINTIIIFIAFVFAFGPLTKTVLWFVPLGVGIIHLMNLFRISMLFFVAQYLPNFMYFTHKYLFTAFLYLVIFLLWVWWVKKNSIKKI